MPKPKSPSIEVIPQIREAEIPLPMVLDPEVPTRQNFDPAQMEELQGSISHIGLLNAICVVKLENGYYRIIAGHRRAIACRNLRHTTIRARIYPSSTQLGVAVQVHENVIREQVNAAEEAEYWTYLLDNVCGGDTNTLAAMLHLSRQHVEHRLLLKSGDEDVFSALGQGLISASVAEELNRCKEKWRRMQYLDAAVRGGATRALIREWRSKGEALDDLQRLSSPSSDAVVTNPEPAPPTRILCELCDGGVEQGAVETMFVHKHCRRSLIDRLLAQYQRQRDEQNAVP